MPITNDLPSIAAPNGKIKAPNCPNCTKPLTFNINKNRSHFETLTTKCSNCGKSTTFTYTEVLNL